MQTSWRLWKTIRRKNSKLVSEGLQCIDFDIQENQRYRDRLDANGMGFGPLAISLMRETKSLPVLFALFRVTGMLSLFICLLARPKKLLMRSGALISFSLKERSYKDYINLGIVIQAIANKIAAHNPASMPLLSGLYLLDILGENPEILSNAAKRTIRRSFNEMNKLLPSQGQRVSFGMRIGYPDRIPPKTVRRNILDLIYRANQKIEA